MHLDPTLVVVVGISLAVVVFGLVLSYLRQPVVIAYLLVGVVLGPGVLGFVGDDRVIGPLGSMGLVLLMFFVGMEIKPPELARSWRIAVFGTVLQIGVSCATAWAIGAYFEWNMARIVLIGFVISLSSTAVVVKLLQDQGELTTPLGQDCLGMLLVQDLAIVPMMIVLGFFGGHAPTSGELALEIGGAVAIVGLVTWVLRHPGFSLPFADYLRSNHELEIFGALVVCLGLAFLSGAVGLSSVLGAFVAGICVSAARQTEWFHDSLQPFHVLLVACFFLSVGLMLDIEFLQARWLEIVLLVAAVFVTNTFINGAVMHLLGLNWRESLYGGAVLSQIGEFSFVLAAMGLAAGIISDDGYQLVVATIALSLVLSPAWIGLLRRLTGYTPMARRVA